MINYTYISNIPSLLKADLFFCKQITLRLTLYLIEVTLFLQEKFHIWVLNSSSVNLGAVFYCPDSTSEIDPCC